ncbi:MAG: PAC2 family protein [Actinobacteria bacterium]|nr:MAG: PAC2 family protein [Actinomycetota bacterium]
MLSIDSWPQLHQPVLIYHLSGWVDAGSAGASAIEILASQLDSARTFARYDLADLLDLQQTRPTVQLTDGETREVVWPELLFTAGKLGRDVVLCLGPEPSVRWQTFSAELVDVIKRLDVQQAYGVGGMPAVVSHRRSIGVLATATSPSLAQEVGALRTDYHGPTGLQTVLQVALGDAGIPTVGLWAQVPHYVAAYPCPPSVRVLVERIRDLAGLAVSLTELDERCQTYLTRVEEGISERPDVQELVRAIEAQGPELPSGDELASEIERFLRNQ